MDLIPDLPNEIARECLVRVSYEQFPTISSVCKGWKLEIEIPFFLNQRKASLRSQKLVAFAQSQVDPVVKPGCATPAYGITLLEPDTGNWTNVPPPPGLSNGLPMFCQLTAVGSDLIVMGGLDPVTWEASGSVYVFDFLSATWRCGTSMPGVRRSFFGCGSDGIRMVYVAGGHDKAKNALKSALAYDVAEDKWIQLPDMAERRDECKLIVHGGKIHVIGGYTTEMQGRFEKSKERFDLSTWQWDPVQENFLKDATSPRTCTRSNADVYMWSSAEGAILKRENDTWREVMKMPSDMVNVASLVTWQDKMLVIGSGRNGESNVAHVLDLSCSRWTKVETPKKYSGHVQSGCCFEI